MNNITITVLVGRNQENLLRLYESIKLLTIVPYEIVLVIDKANSIEFDESSFLLSDVSVIFLYVENKRQPYMRNLGLKHATGNYVWFIDDDVTLKNDSLFNLSKLINNIKSDQKIGCIAGKIIEVKDFVKNFKKPINFTFFRGFIGDFSIDKKSLNERYFSFIEIGTDNYPIVLHAQGTSMIFNREMLMTVSGFDEDLDYGYCSFEDTDPCLALFKEKLVTIYASEIELTHHKLIRIGGITRGYDNYTYQSSFIRNFIIVMYKNKYPRKYLCFINISAFIFFHFIRILKYNGFFKIKKGFFNVMYNSTKSVFSGVRLGLATLSKSTNRINTQF
ncbi:glycosyltransferase [Flavobacterium sp.]|jgi:glycosyltransferase involved in cell wall biosynthesis|uniref:glycosyltransferase family 2 protein n=1 Tax=Flavobacterium sp. TaxID=239 RepID=UPI0022CA2298|nr:glycosyltransferase [Flavobacterium sp.]MCZ8230044.1 glycosyltransferase [Flavobacterium sp.]